MKKILSAAAVAAALLAAPAMAQAADVYGSIGLGTVDSSPVRLGAVQVRGGLQLTPFIGVEIEAAKGISGDKVLATDIDMSSEAGVFLTARWNFAEKGALVGRIGYAQAKFEASIGPVTVSDTQDGAAFGLGLEGQVSDNNSLRLDWTRYAFSTDADAWTVALVHKF